MRTALAAAAVIAAVFGQSATSFAQFQGDSPFCIQVYTSSNIITRCEYASFAQCQALNDGRNNVCTANPYYKGPPPRAPRR